MYRAKKDGKYTHDMTNNRFDDIHTNVQFEKVRYLWAGSTLGITERRTGKDTKTKTLQGLYI